MFYLSAVKITGETLLSNATTAVSVSRTDSSVSSSYSSSSTSSMTDEMTSLDGDEINLDLSMDLALDVMDENDEIGKLVKEALFDIAFEE